MAYSMDASSFLEEENTNDALQSLNRPLQPLPGREQVSPHPFKTNILSTRQHESNRKRMKSSGSHAMVPKATLGQFSTATQTTVVTTTTTTTTKYPPFVVRPPRRMQELDPKHYPLAASPTPVSLRSIRFDFGGKPTFFQESPDSTVALEQFKREQETIHASDGAIRSVTTSGPVQEASFSDTSNDFTVPQKPLNPRQRPVSPVSLSEAMENVRRTRSTRHKRGISGTTQLRRLDNAAGSSRKTSRISSLSSIHPATPDAELQSELSDERREKERVAPKRGEMAGPSMSRRIGQTETPQTSGARPNVPDRYARFAQDDTPSVTRQGEMVREESSDLLLRRENDPSCVVPTPPIEGEEAAMTSRADRRRGPSSIPSRLNVFENVQSNDASLPSPSLSPVTAAAQMHNAGEYFNRVEDNDNDVDLSFGSTTLGQPDEDDSFQDTPSRMDTDHETLSKTASDQSISPSEQPRMPLSSINDIPQMIDFFEAIPDELKSYVMHQLLRRCPKSTLHVVADVVNPALKCDFLGNLPLELSLQIVKHLDVKSLCRASQVSKKWRHIISNDQQAWKELFDADGFELAEGELLRSIREGWGWQDPSGPNGWEQDISSPRALKSDSDRSIPSTPIMQLPAFQSNTLATNSTSRRPKRKAATKLSNRSKQVKKKDVSKEHNDALQSVDWMTYLSTAEGPNHAATAAMVAVPYPSAGLSSLKEMHLYKSLYRRHYLIRKSWMQEDVKPRHIAFRAHDRHVVTCLQFDTDKILTGSDDTNINVYDTKTGALRTTLRGHEGGVWALQYEGNVLVSGSTDRSVRVWDIEHGRQMQVFHGHTSTVRCLQILMPSEVGRGPDGKPIMLPKQPLIITGSRDSNLRVWKLPQPKDPYYFQAGPPQDDADCPYFVRILAGHQHSVRAIAAHADTLISGSYDCTVRVWKISTGETLHRLQGHTQKVYSVVLDHARNRCISGSMDNLVKIWSLDTGSVLYTLEGHSSLVGLLDLNCDRLVSAAADSTLRIWDPENGQCKATLSAHTGAITCFQHDGQKVISGSDRTLKMWNVKTGECVKDLLTDLSGVWQVKFNERRCAAAVQRSNMTYIEVLDFGASRDGVPPQKRGHRIVVDEEGREVHDPADVVIDLDAGADD